MNFNSLIYQSLPQPQSGHTFSAKEKDDETGYSYFGARYYDSELSVWLSVDPMSDFFPSVSAFTYCFNNPIRFVDPFGLAPGEPNEGKVTTLPEVVIYGEKPSWMKRTMTKVANFFSNVFSGNSTKQNTNQKSNNTASKVSSKIGAASVGYDTWSNVAYDANHYNPTKGPNAGKPTSVWRLTKSGNCALDNGAKFPNSLKAAEKIKLNGLVKAGGNALNWIGLGLTIYDIRNNGLNWENGTDAVVGGVTFIPGVGWVVSGTYIGGKIFFEAIKNNTEELIQNGINPGDPIFFK